MNTKTFCIPDNVRYKEKILNEGLFYKVYEIINPKKVDFITIPDGAYDIQCLWKNEVLEIKVSGSCKKGFLTDTAGYDRCVGLRFKPGIVPECFKGRIKDIINNHQSISNFIEIGEVNINYNSTKEDILDYFNRKIARYNLFEDNEIVNYIIDNIYNSNGCINIADLVYDIGYSHRHIDRTFKNYIGFSIKNYANIIRMQNALNFMISGKENDIYDKLYYYDQSNFINNFKKFTSVTPLKFKRNYMNSAIY